MTLVFTDIEGSTRLLEQLGTDGYRAALAEHRRIVRQACAGHEGYEVDTEGDSFFYAFQSAQHAVQAIAEAMTGLHGGPIKIRVGIHTGEPALDPPNYLGLDVHRAARIMSAAHGGQVVALPFNGLAARPAPSPSSRSASTGSKTSPRRSTSTNSNRRAPRHSSRHSRRSTAPTSPSPPPPSSGGKPESPRSLSD